MELTLRPRRAKQAALAALCAGFCAIAVVMIRDGQIEGWLCLAFFGLGCVIFLVQLVPGASYLRLDPERLTIRSLFRSSSYEWADIAGFAPGRVGGNRTVVFEFSEHYTGHERLRGVSRAMTGAEACLPDTYGHSADRLAELLNDWKRGLRRLDP